MRYAGGNRHPEKGNLLYLLSKFYRRHSALLEKYSVSLKTLLQQGISEPEFYGDSVCACLDLSISSSSLGLGRAAVCDCGTPWTFLLPFLELLMGKFRKVFTELSSQDTPIFSFPEDNLSK